MDLQAMACLTPVILLPVCRYQEMERERKRRQLKTAGGENGKTSFMQAAKLAMMNGGLISLKKGEGDGRGNKREVSLEQGCGGLQRCACANTRTQGSLQFWNPIMDLAAVRPVAPSLASSLL
jgi:hypothetical protein